MSSNSINDNAVVLAVKNWQTADKYAVCFTEQHGKVRFIAYGARYPKNTAGRLLQPFASLNIEITSGQKIDRLKNCELIKLPLGFDFKEMAYGSVITEATAVLTEDREPQEEIYNLLQLVFPLLKKHNPRIVTLAYVLKLLTLTGLQPNIENCVLCGRHMEDAENGWFSSLHGGIVCDNCSHGAEEEFTSDTRELFNKLLKLDFVQPQPFSVKGKVLMELERIVCKFLLFQTDKPLKSIDYLSKLNL